MKEARYPCANRPKRGKTSEVGTGFEPVYTALQAAASPLGQPTVDPNTEFVSALRADNGARTRDLNLGKVALYQLSYVRTVTIAGNRE